jgi:serine/threonine protein kinase
MPVRAADGWCRLLSQLQGISRLDKDFERLELLGKGAFGEVWRCKHRIDGKEYAIKMVRFTGRGLDGPGVEEHVLREVHTWASLSHAKIAGYKNAWIEGDWNRPVSEWIGPSSQAIGVNAPAKQQVSSVPSEYSAGSGISSGFDDSAGVIFERPTADLSAPSEHDTQEDLVLPTTEQIVASAPKSPTSNALASLSLTKNVKYGATLYIQSELCRKDTLFDWLVQQNSKEGVSDDMLDRSLEALDIFFQCMSALEHMHSKGYVHRDVKPSNILFGLDGTLRLGDFGLAKILSQASPNDTTLQWKRFPDDPHTAQVGTPSYASPEQLEGHQSGVSADIYSMGIILVELMCPMKTQMERSSIFNALHKQLEVPEFLIKSFPPLGALASRMIQHEPADRPTAKDVLMAAPSIIMELRNMYGVTSLPHSLSLIEDPSYLHAAPRAPRKKSNSNQSSPLISPKIVLLPGARKKIRSHHSSPKLSPELAPLPRRARAQTVESDETIGAGKGRRGAQDKGGKTKDSSGSGGNFKRLTARSCRRACTFSGLRARHVSGLSWRKTLYRRGWLAGMCSARALWGSETCKF